MTFRHRLSWLWLFAVFTAIGTFFALHTYLSGTSDSLAVRFYFEMTGAWSAMLLVPGISWLTRAAPIARGTIGRVVAANAAGVVTYTLLHSTLELLMRYAAQPLVGRHETLLHMASYTYPSEAPSDVVYYGFIVSALYLINYFVASQELEAKLAEVKLENLQLQLQPHFLFNTLNAISSVMYEDVRKADRMLSRLSDFMRAVLATSGVQAVPIDEELRIEQIYVDIMKTRLERNLQLGVRVGEGAGGALVPFMLLQPLLENSIRHGMGSERKSIDLDIDVTRHNGSTVIRVGDDGIGYTTTACDGIGLSNVRARLHYMYGKDATFAIEPRTNGGTIATITLPFKEGALE